ncbi:hypothetical protein O7626_04310 [Micromonospora sp. WMMD1102]|uniref:hypothetical protein n=1 Tax=Micromonospora sp. WMMD1102 TaxID=3016105 RepID=UPI0024155F16|nr:hypothetical protein [Micromonospora sp. WMMD1102]MDG4785163.1 hypothetical protein [Micromonospora sp. WMMD1102]
MPVLTLTRVPRGLLTHSLGAVLAMVALSSGCAGGTDSTPSANRDATTVRCLSLRYRAELVDAAVALGLAQRGSSPDTLVVRGETLSLEQWRQRYSTDFNRGCAALVVATGGLPAPTGAGAGGGGGSPDPVALAFLAALLSLLAGLVTAVFGGFVTSLLTSAGQRRLHADSLRRAGRDLAEAAARYLDSWLGDGSREPAEALLERRRAVLALLHQQQLTNPRWDGLRAARAEFDAAPFDRPEMLDTFWLDPDVDRAEFAQRIDEQVHRMTAVTYWVADGLDHPIRFRWRTGNRLPSPAKLASGVPDLRARSAEGRGPG